MEYGVGHVGILGVIYLVGSAASTCRTVSIEPEGIHVIFSDINFIFYGWEASVLSML